MMFCKYTMLTAWSTDVFADHFLPALVCIPAPTILLSAVSRNVINKRCLETLKSSTTEDTVKRNCMELLCGVQSI